MAEIRVLVGTRKGAFVITSDGARRDWRIEGPHFGGWEVMHVQGSPADPDRLGPGLVPTHDPHRPCKHAAHVRGHLGGGGVPHR